MNLKQRIYEILETHSGEDKPGQLFKFFITALIVTSTLSVILETVPYLADRYQLFFHWFEIFTITIFTIEYAARLWSCTTDSELAHPITGRIRMALRPLTLVDLLAIAPFYFPLFGALDLRFMRSLRLLRLLRLFKLGRYSDSLHIMGRVFRAKKGELSVTLFVASILLIIVSSLMFFIENSAQPDKFSSIPAAMWWGMATLTTIGYGDIFPITLAGKVLGSFSALIGIGMFALPAGILGSAFMEEINKRNLPKICPHCKKALR